MYQYWTNMCSPRFLTRSVQFHYDKIFFFSKGWRVAHKSAKKYKDRGQYPAVSTEQASSIESFLYHREKSFSWAKKRTVPSKLFSPIFDCLWVADQDPGFSTSQTTLIFFRDYCFRFCRWLTLQEATEMKFNWWILKRLIWNLTRLGWKQPLLITPGIYSIVFHDQIT